MYAAFATRHAFRRFATERTVAVRAVLRHAPTEPGLVGDGQQARGVRPVLEELAVRARHSLQLRHVISTEPAERHDELGARDHVDGVELDRADRVDERSQVPAPDRALGPRLREALRGDREPARFGQRELGSRSHRRILRSRLYGIGPSPVALESTV